MSIDSLGLGMRSVWRRESISLGVIDAEGDEDASSKMASTDM